MAGDRFAGLSREEAFRKGRMETQRWDRYALHLYFEVWAKADRQIGDPGVPQFIVQLDDCQQPKIKLGFDTLVEADKTYQDLLRTNAVEMAKKALNIK